MRSHIKRLPAIVMTVFSMVVLIGWTSQTSLGTAGDPSSSPTPSETSGSETEEHCHATPYRQGAVPPDAPPPVAHCHESFEAAVFHAVGVRLPEGVGPHDLNDELLNRLYEIRDAERTSAVALSSDVLIGADFEHINLGGSSLLWHGPERCDANTSYEADSMPSGWNDRVSSADNLGDCNRFHHLEHTNQLGDNYPCNDNSTNPDLHCHNDMCCWNGYNANDKTSSLYFWD